MDYRQNIIQVYKVLISVVAIVVSIPRLISSLLGYENLLYVRYSETQLSFFQYFKLFVLESSQKKQAYKPGYAFSQKIYVTTHSDKIISTIYNTNHISTVNIFMMLFSGIICQFNWCFIGRVEKVELKKVNSG